MPPPASFGNRGKTPSTLLLVACYWWLAHSILCRLLHCSLLCHPIILVEWIGDHMVGYLGRRKTLWGPYFTHPLGWGCFVSQPFCPTALRAASSICRGVPWASLPVDGLDGESTLLAMCWRLLLGNPGRVGGLLGLVVCWLLDLSLATFKIGLQLP
jgi:hypothetical protein